MTLDTLTLIIIKVGESQERRSRKLGKLARIENLLKRETFEGPRENLGTTCKQTTSITNRIVFAVSSTKHCRCFNATPSKCLLALADCEGNSILCFRKCCEFSGRSAEKQITLDNQGTRLVSEWRGLISERMLYCVVIECDNETL